MVVTTKYIAINPYNTWARGVKNSQFGKNRAKQGKKEPKTPKFTTIVVN
jgi:hypothetical protein